MDEIFFTFSFNSNWKNGKGCAILTKSPDAGENSTLKNLKKHEKMI